MKYTNNERVRLGRNFLKLHKYEIISQDHENLSNSLCF